MLDCHLGLGISSRQSTANLGTKQPSLSLHSFYVQALWTLVPPCTIYLAVAGSLQGRVDADNSQDAGWILLISMMAIMVSWGGLVALLGRRKFRVPD